MRIAFREEALADLDEIAQFIGREDPGAAERVVARIHKTICPQPDCPPARSKR